jgi:hypothetical protein
VEDVDAEQPFFQAGGVSGQGALYQVPQQLGGAAAGGELVAGENDVEMLAYLRVGQSGGFVFLGLSLFVLIRLGHHNSPQSIVTNIA